MNEMIMSCGYQARLVQWLSKCGHKTMCPKEVTWYHLDLVARIYKFPFVTRFSLIIQRLVQVTVLFEGRQCNELSNAISAYDA